MLGHHSLVELLAPGNRRAREILGQLRLDQRLGRPHVLDVGHARHALVEQLHEVDVHVDEVLRRDLVRHRRRRHRDVGRHRRELGPERHIGDGLGLGRVTGHELRVRRHHVVALHEGLHGELPVHGQPRRVPPLDLEAFDVPGVVDVGELAERLAQRRRVVVEVDERASAPGLDAARAQREIGAAQLIRLEERRRVDELALHRRTATATHGTGR